MTKTYVVDTNIIIANPYFFREFNDCTIMLPIYVLEELDKLKSRAGNSGFRARQFFRVFKKIEKQGNLLEGIEVAKNVVLKSSLEKLSGKLPENYDLTYADNKILSLMLSPGHIEDMLITNDVSMRLKASALGIKCKYIDLSDKHKLEDLYSGVLERQVRVEDVKKFYREGEVSMEELGIGYPVLIFSTKPKPTSIANPYAEPARPGVPANRANGAANKTILVDRADFTVQMSWKPTPPTANAS